MPIKHWHNQASSDGACRADTAVGTSIGLSPQGKDAATADKIFEQAKALEAVRVFAIVLENMPADLGQRITEALGILTIGIRAGDRCDGQVLVTHDLLGLSDWQPPFRPFKLALHHISRYNNPLHHYWMYLSVIILDLLVINSQIVYAGIEGIAKTIHE